MFSVNIFKLWYLFENVYKNTENIWNKAEELRTFKGLRFKWTLDSEAIYSKSQVVIVVKNTPVHAGGIRDAGSIPGSGRSPGGGRGNPLQYSCLENPMDRGAWQATVHSVAQGRTQLKQLSTQNALNSKENEDLWYLDVWQINTQLCLGNSKPHECCWKAKSDFHQRSQNCFACSLLKDLSNLWTWVQSSVHEAHLISSFELGVHESKPQCWTHF